MMGEFKRAHPESLERMRRRRLRGPEGSSHRMSKLFRNRHRATVLSRLPPSSSVVPLLRKIATQQTKTKASFAWM